MGFIIRKCRILRMKLKKHWLTVLWIVLCSGMFYMDFICYHQEPQYYYLRRMLGVGMCISRGTAAILNLSCCVLVVPMCRALATNLSSAFKYLVSAFQERPLNSHRPPTLPAFLTSRAMQTAKSIHVMIAVTMALSSVLHTGAHISNAINFSRYYSSQYPDINVAAYKGENPFYLFVATVPGITGAAMILVLCVLALTSTKWARRRNYNTFFYAHHLGLLFFILLLIHPLSGILKEQKNLHRHSPGCQMYGSSVAEEGFPEPEPMYYHGVFGNDSMLKKENQASVYQSSTSYPNNQDNYLSTAEYYSSEADSFDGNSEDDQGDAEIKVYLWRKMCHEAPVFQSIHSKTWIWVLVAFALWAADSIMRWWRQRPDVSVLNVVHHPCDVVQLTLHQSGFSCTPGQYVLIQCPSVSRFEWHPFTVTCPPSKLSSDTFTILMRVRGDWSKRVADVFHPNLLSSQQLDCNVLSNDSLLLKQSIIKNSSLASTKHTDQSSSQTCDTGGLCDKSNYGVFGQKIVCSSANHCVNIRCCQNDVKKCKSYSFSPGDFENRNLRSHKHSLFCKSSSPVHSDFLCANLSLLQENTNCSCSDCGLVHPYSENLQNSHLHSQSHISKCTSCLERLGHNSYKKDSSNEIGHQCLGENVHTQSFYPQTSLPSHCSNQQHSNTNNNSRGDKEDHNIDIGSFHLTRLRIDGPYSSPSEEMLQYPVIIGAVGGVGITPLAATLSHKLWHPTMWPKRIHMVWVVRDARLLLVIAPLLSSLLLLSWQMNMEDSIELRLHVTLPTSKEVLQDIFARDYPSLLPRISQGRPHWKHLFTEWHQIYARKKVGIFTCGPPKMCRQVRRHCVRAVTKGAQFNYHQESFS